MIDKIIKLAQNELGYKEGANNDTKYGQAYGLNHSPWCQMFIWWIANKSGIETNIIPKTASCPTAYRWFRDRKQIIENSTVQQGDIIFFQWSNSKNADHVGIVEAVKGDMITTIEGNKNDAVERRYIRTNNPCIFAICRPAYTVEKTVEPTTPYPGFYIKNGSRGSHVRAVQTKLIKFGYSCGRCGVDGIFGQDTLSAVKTYQKANGLSVDGIVGPLTWNKLF